MTLLRRKGSVLASMEEKKPTASVVSSVRYAPAEWKRVKAKAKELGVPASRLIYLATMRLLGDRTDLDQATRVAGALDAVRPLG